MVTTHIMTLLMLCVILSISWCPDVQTVNACMSKHADDSADVVLPAFEQWDLLWICMQPDPHLLT